MCGIVGLFAKSAEVEERLGAQLGAMLAQMADRGPDSAGLAVYRHPAPPGATKLSLFSEDPEEDWAAIARELDPRHDGEVAVHASHAVLVVDADAATAQALVRERRPDLRVMSAGERIEIFKEMGDPQQFVTRFALADMQGTHGLAHTRMATESRVTTQASHPFSTGLDLCLVHNGSLSKHNRLLPEPPPAGLDVRLLHTGALANRTRLRAELRRECIEFQTDNDTEVAAGYLTWRLREGASLDEALRGCLRDLDGFYPFLVGTVDGFAVLRDPIACKPAVLAETDDWVAMASEYRAIAVLPGAEEAAVWEPEPARVYSWERAAV